MRQDDRIKYINYFCWTLRDERDVFISTSFKQGQHLSKLKSYASMTQIKSWSRER
jgi:hypothetical protein